MAILQGAGYNCEIKLKDDNRKLKIRDRELLFEGVLKIAVSALP